MFGVQGPEFFVLLLVAMVVIGPERLPEQAKQLGQLVRKARGMADGARAQVRQELGPEFDEVDWKKLDPRQYDPRRIVREALADSGVGTAADYDLDTPLLDAPSRPSLAKPSDAGLKPGRRPDEAAGPSGATPFDPDAT